MRIVVAVLISALGAGLFAAADTVGVTERSRSASWTFRVSFSGDFPPLDPALLPPGQPLWPELEYATCAKLLNYPDRGGKAGSRVHPEVAAGFPRISRGGRKYTFTIRRGFRFNTGALVTASTFAYAINRDLNPALASPAVTYLQDIVGARAVISGRAATASGVRAVSTNTLVIRLIRPAFDLVARLAMPYFCAIPKDLPATPGGVTPPSSAGPYYYSEYVRGQRLVLRRNPFYRGSRPRKPATIVWSLNQPLNTIALQVERGDADYGIIGIADRSRLARDYGVNRRQFFVAPTPSVVCLALNTQRPLFKNNVALRKAVNYAIDRPALIEQFGGFGRATDQYLAPSMPGFSDARLYPLERPFVKKAKALAAGHLRSRRAVLYLRNASATAQARGQIIQANLARIGLQVDVVIQDRTHDPARRGEPFDMVDVGCPFPDYPDPYATLVAGFDGRQIRDEHNSNLSYLNNRRFNRLFAAASRLTGPARYRAFGQIDVELARDVAPAAAYMVIPRTVFVSARIGCVRINPVYGLSSGAACLR